MKVTRRSMLGGAAGLAALTGLSACGGGRDGSSTSTTTAAAGSSGSGAASGGFDAGSTIGVALPWLGTQNWKEAQDMFKADLESAGYKAVIQAADNKVANQQSQIEAMIQQGAKVIVVGPVDGKQLGTVLAKAHDAGVKVIGYDRLIENTTAIDGVVQFGSLRTGELQGLQHRALRWRPHRP